MTEYSDFLGSQWHSETLLMNSARYDKVSAEKTPRCKLKGSQSRAGMTMILTQTTPYNPLQTQGTRFHPLSLRVCMILVTIVTGNQLGHQVPRQCCRYANVYLVYYRVLGHIPLPVNLFFDFNSWMVLRLSLNPMKTA